MALIVEDGTGLNNADAYVSVAYASAYHAALANDEWAAATLPRATFTARRQAVALETVTVGGVTLQFVDDAPAADEVRIGSTIAETLANVLAALVFDPSKEGTAYVNTTTFTGEVSGSVSGNSLTLTATAPGASIAVSGYLTSSPNTGPSSLQVPTSVEASIRKATQYIEATYGQRFYGVRKTDAQALSWPRTDAYNDDDVRIDEASVPRAVAEATCEVALTVVKGGLVLTDVQPDSGASLTSESVSVGGLSVSQSFASPRDSHTRMPKVDALLRGVAAPAGTLVRG